MDEIKITNPGRVIDPTSGATKGELAQYYRAIGPLMMPWATNRLLSLVRCPQGLTGECFFQRHDSGSFGPGTFGDAMRPFPVIEKSGETENYLYIIGENSLAACAQMNVVELHGWGSRITDIERPDRLVFDLDPGEGVSFAMVGQAAAELGQRLDRSGLVSFPLLTGGKGIHVVAPLTPHAAWPEVSAFARNFCTALAAAEPKRFTIQLAKAKRKRRIFLDYLRNQRSASAILPYSARARSGLPVATPISWDELDKLNSSARFTVRDAALLRERAASPSLQSWGVAEQILPEV